MGLNVYAVREEQKRDTVSTSWAQTHMPGLISLLHIMAWCLKTQDPYGTHLIVFQMVRADQEQQPSLQNLCSTAKSWS